MLHSADTFEWFAEEGKRAYGQVIPNSAPGKRHLVLYLMGAGPDPAIPLLRAGVRKWRRFDDSLQLTTLAGHYTEKRDVVVEPGGAVEMRRLEVIGGIIRIFQDGQGWLDFARIE